MALKSLKAIKQVENGNRAILKEETWLKYLVLTKENKVNLERIHSMDELTHNQTLAYVKRTLEILHGLDAPQHNKQVVEEVLKWSEVAKGGMPSVRKAWRKKGIDLYAHNIGSGEIYKMSYPENQLIYTLIQTHGLIGQFLRGEVLLKENMPITRLVEAGDVKKEEMIAILELLNACIVRAVSPELWEKVQKNIKACIVDIVDGRYKEMTLKEKLQALRKESMERGEEIDTYYENALTSARQTELEAFLNSVQLWYIEPALKEFSFEEMVKIFLLISTHSRSKPRKYVTLEPFMNHIYYDYQGKKKINIYKKRVIEKYLKEMTLEEITAGKLPENKHVNISVMSDVETVLFDFEFSKVGETLIDFCVEAEKADVEHEKAIILLFDLFDLRRDSFDRFHNEERYLDEMHKSADDKRILLAYIKGTNVLDIGPGSGVILDMVTEAFPEKKVAGIDISQNVIEELNRKKLKENRTWQVSQGDAFRLSEHVQKNSIDTIIYSSIIHEFYSYIPYEGKKFNHKTIASVLKSAFDVLVPGGRIIIRDGVMTDSDEKRIIEWKEPNGLTFLKRYVRDFQGRKIQYETLGENKVKMPVNDAMEFLYTYTWGEDSYVHEVNEQFGYFTPKAYEAFIYNTLGKENVRIIEQQHYLQPGYVENLQHKINFYNEQGEETPLPDSTGLIVIEKI